MTAIKDLGPSLKDGLDARLYWRIYDRLKGMLTRRLDDRLNTRLKEEIDR